jgi:hypothetical protein
MAGLTMMLSEKDLKIISGAGLSMDGSKEIHTCLRRKNLS